MKDLRRFCLVAVILGIAMATFTFTSCSSGGGDDDGETSATQNASVQTTSFTSTDSTNGYFNVNGGQYRTITFSGTDTNGNVTLSNGIAADISGTYTSANTSRAAVVEGNSYLFKLNGITHSYSATITTEGGIFIAETTADGNTSKLFIGGGESTIPTGSSEDPFAGTKWYSTKTAAENDSLYSYSFIFSNGRYYTKHDYEERDEEKGLPYTVSKTADGGYKASWCTKPTSSQMTHTDSRYNGSYTSTSFFNYTFIIKNSTATKGNNNSTIINTRFGTGYYEKQSGTSTYSSGNGTDYYRPACN